MVQKNPAEIINPERNPVSSDKRSSRLVQAGEGGLTAQQVSRDLLEKTKQTFEPYAGRSVPDEEARQIIDGVHGFFVLLDLLARKYKVPSSNSNNIVTSSTFLYGSEGKE